MEKNPFVQAGALSTDLGEIPRASPFPNPFDQAGAIDGGVDQLKDSYRFIPLCHILKATNDFDDALVTGTGGFGKVYKANIDDGATTTVVAIKRLSANSRQGATEFWTELELLSKFRHANLVSLIGYCNEYREMIIVYEYMAKGTLADHLYKTSTREESGGSRSHLTWEQRLNICLDAGRGLDYLHNGGIIHRDVKSTNILLDEYLVAKVSDLGISKSMTTYLTTHVSTNVKGTFGYLDPDYSLTHRLTRKSDVYAFGVVLLEVLSGRPPDQYGEKNPSPTWKMLSTNGQTEMGNQMVGHLEETNEFLQDFVEGPHGGISSEWAFQQNNQWTVSTSYPNSNGPEVPHPHIASTQILGENMESLGDRRNSFGSLEEHLLQGHISGSMWTVPPCSDPASSQHMPTITPTMGSSEDRINSLAFVEDLFLEEDDSGSIRWTIPTCSEPAPSQLMPTVPRTTGITDDLRNLLPLVEESFSVGDVSGFINRTVPSCSYPALSQPMSTVPHTTGSSDDLRNLLASVKEPIWAGRVSESINLTVPSCSNPAPCQSMPSILHTMPTNPRMMPLLIERQDTRSVNLKAMYGDTTIKFQFPLTSGINELKEEVSKILECKLGSFNIEYKDEDGDWILMARDENVREYLQLLTSLGNQVTKLKLNISLPIFPLLNQNILGNVAFSRASICFGLDFTGLIRSMEADRVVIINGKNAIFIKNEK
ncbi:hypothetical protein RHGRI_013062 [Rhododendron griersonianum]|uniref:Uncharacterized protein n=1 Tax=Rhododendron griersonianum TaxID=479676 RepID=A0AAV6K482_9ERIC|nr:hypothetical protein RHGRI_013062 [Rhododendron griersonianum]